MSSPLKDTSMVVLGLVELCDAATPYDLKKLAEVSVFNFWSIPHTQIYTECARLTESGHLSESREEGGRRRRTYSLTSKGREALADWRSHPGFDPLELRDTGLIRLFFGADPAELAQHQLAGHRAHLETYEGLREAVKDLPEGVGMALECGIGQERAFIRFWSKLVGEEAKG